MPERIPAATAKKVVFRAISSTDHFTPATGKTIAITISKNGGAFGNPNAGATNATEISSGFYKFDLDTTDTNTNGPLAWRGAGTGLDDVGDAYEVVNATNAGFTALPNVASGSAGAVITSGTGATQLSVSSGNVTVGGYAAGQVPLQPTVAGRTLDVSAGGEAGVDWANVGSPTTAVGLTGTTISTAQAIASVGDVDGSVAGTVGGIAAGGITSSSFVAGAINAAAIAADAIGASELAADAVAEIADAVWDEARSGHTTAGTFGQGVASVQGNVTGSVGSVTGAVGSVTGDVGGNVTGSVGSVATGGITAASIATGAIDADALAADAVAEIADGVWDEAIAGHLSAGSTGAALNGATAPSAAAVADAVWDEALAGHLSAGSTGEALNAAGAAGDPWATALPGAYGAGSAGYIMGTNLNATVSSRASQTSLDTLDDYVDTEVAAIKAKTDNLPASPAATGDIPSAAAVADAVWDEALAGHAAAGSTGEALSAAGAAGDPWSTALPGAYGAGSAGYIIGTNVNATISSRSTLDAAGVRAAVGLAAANLDTQLGAIDDFLDTEVAAIKAKTDNLPAAPAATGDIPTAIQNADALLARDIGSGSGAGSLDERTVRSALRFVRNKWAVAGGTLTVKKEDDATTAWTATVSTDAAADPVIGSDPA